MTGKRFIGAGFFVCFGVLVLVAGMASSLAQEVTAHLSGSQAYVGESVELTITAEGSSQAEVLDDLDFNGLNVASRSQSFQMQLGFPKFERRVTTTFRFTLVPMREGDFSIPSLRVRMDGKIFKTPVLELQVGGARSQPGGPGGTVPPGKAQGFGGGVPMQPPFGRDGEAKVFFGELVIPKESVYVGEVLPVDMRFYVDARYPVQFSERPFFSGDGFTVQRAAQPIEARGELGGVIYRCVIFRGAITAAKTGRLDVPPAKLNARIQLPMEPPAGMGGIFDQFFQGMGFSDVRDVEILTGDARVEVKPLPSEGRPENFSGAVGQFRMTASVSPQRVGEGEPVTLKVRVSGRGNFGGIGTPELVNPEGWRVYEPTRRFEPSPSDPVGFNGEMTYEFVMMAQEGKNATPGVRFSFFDPKAERYETLEVGPLPVDAAGMRSVVASAASPEPEPSPDQQLAQSRVEMVGDLSTDFGERTFRPFAWSPGFIWSSFVLGLVWAVMVVAGVLRRSWEHPEFQRRKRERDLRKELRKIANSDGDEFLDRAARYVEMRLGGRELEDINLADGLGEKISELLERRARVRFGTAPPEPLREDEKAEMLRSLREFDARV